MEKVRYCIIDAFQSQYLTTKFIDWSGPTVRTSVDNVENGQYPGLIAEIRQLRSEDWIFGRTPQFHFLVYGTGIDDIYDITVENGRIKDSSLIHKDFPIGKKFHHAFIKSALLNYKENLDNKCRYLFSMD